MTDTYVDQSKVVFIDWKLLRTNVFLQSGGIGALREGGENVTHRATKKYLTPSL